MNRKWMLMLSAVCALALGVATSASASAASWHVEGKALEGSHKVAEPVKTIKAWILKTKALTITCSNVKLKEAVLESPNKGKGPGLTFTGCIVTSAEASCEIPEETITTKAVTTSTVESGSNDATTFSPTTEEEGKKVFTTIVIKSKSGKTCGVAKSAKVTGTATGLTAKTEAETEQTGHKVTFSSTSGSALKLGSEEAEFSGEGELSLSPAEKWSFR